MRDELDADAATPTASRRLRRAAAARSRRGRRASSPATSRRIVRALEVIELTGRPFSSFGPGLADVRRRRRSPSRMAGVWLPARRARRAASSRASRPCATPGLVDEVRALRDRGGAVPHRRARRSATGRCSTTSTARAVARRRARGRRRAHPAVRPPPAHVVPARPARSRWFGAAGESVHGPARPPGKLEPMTAVRLSKLHATGNDFLVCSRSADASPVLDPDAVARALRPPPGIGADGLIVDQSGERRRRLHDGALQRRRWHSPR